MEMLLIPCTGCTFFSSDTQTHTISVAIPCTASDGQSDSYPCFSQTNEWTHSDTTTLVFRRFYWWCTGAWGKARKLEHQVAHKKLLLGLTGATRSGYFPDPSPALLGGKFFCLFFHPCSCWHPRSLSLTLCLGLLVAVLSLRQHPHWQKFHCKLIKLSSLSSCR